MEILWFLGFAVAVFIAWLIVKHLLLPFARWRYQRRMEQEAELELLQEMNWQRAQQAAAGKILRKSGQKP